MNKCNICKKDYTYVKWGGGESAFCKTCEFKIKGFFIIVIIVVSMTVLMILK